MQDLSRKTTDIATIYILAMYCKERTLKATYKTK